MGEPITPYIGTAPIFPLVCAFVFFVSLWCAFQAKPFPSLRQSRPSSSCSAGVKTPISRTIS
jgi:hypothetical protein